MFCMSIMYVIRYVCIYIYINTYNVKRQHCPTHMSVQFQHVSGCYWQHPGSTCLEPGPRLSVQQHSKTARTATAATEWQHCCLETFHGSGAVILEASRWAPRTAGATRAAAQHTTTATTSKGNKHNNKVRKERAWSQLYSVGDSQQQGWQWHMR